MKLNLLFSSSKGMSVRLLRKVDEKQSQQSKIISGDKSNAGKLKIQGSGQAGQGAQTAVLNS